MSRVWSPEEVQALGVRTDLVTACSIVYGCGRTKAYELYDRDELDFPTLRAGNRIVVPTAPIRALLGLDPAESSRAAAASNAAIASPFPPKTQSTRPGGGDAA